jgi:peroxiredoxin
MMKGIKLIFLFIVINFSVTAQNVTIKGSAKTYENNEVGVWVHNDYISNTERQLTFVSIDSLGDFFLEFNSKEIQYITLKIDKHIKSKTEINALTIDYDKRFDDFLAVEYKSFVSRRAQPKIDSFSRAMRVYYVTVNNSYFKAYMDYTIASLQEKTKMSEKKLYANYIENKPILYNHTEYMNFFNTFYKQKLQTFSQSKQASDIVSQINDRNSLEGVINILKGDSFLQNDTIRELVIIKGLYESYYDGSFRRSSVLSLLEQILNQTQVPEHKRIVQNILNSFSKLQPGIAAPPFELPDKTGRTHNLDEFRLKKYVYIMFFDANCTSCLQQLKVIPSLKKEYGKGVDFVAVSTDKTNAALNDFCLKNPKYDWLFLYDNTEGKLKKEYEIKALPSYFLIDPEGKFVQVPAESPEGDIERAFFDITKPKGKKHNVGEKANH